MILNEENKEDIVVLMSLIKDMSNFKKVFAAEEIMHIVKVLKKLKQLI